MTEQKNIHARCLSEDINERLNALMQLKSNFLYLPDKQQAWEDLHRLINEKKYSVKSHAADTLGCSFPYIPDKQQAWEDLHRIINKKYSSMREQAIFNIGSIFLYIPDKQQAWNDLHKLANDRNISVRFGATVALGSAFAHVPDKQQAWNDLIRLTSDEDELVRSSAASALGSAFAHVPDKQQSWNYLIRLISNEYGSVSYNAALALGSAFVHMSDKQLAWNDLNELANDRSISERFGAAVALGSAFAHVPYKQKAWNYLIKLTSDDNESVRAYANHSLGKVSIFKASQAEKEENYKEELEKAIEFFEKAAQETHYGLNPAQFCLPFYRSFHTIVFKKREAKEEEEVDKYLAEAKDAIEGSKSKELLFEAVNNLASALKEVQNLENLDFKMKKDELSFYRQYCDHAAELMEDTEESAPFATRAMRKGLPILDRNLKGLIKEIQEIQEKARSACKESKGTVTEEIAFAVNREVQKWEIGSQEEMTQNIEDLIEIFRMKMPHLPGYEHIFEEIEGIRNINDLVKQYKVIYRLVGLIPIFSSMPDHVVQDIKDIKENTTSTLNEVRFLQLLADRFIESIDELQNPQEYLNTIQQNLEEIRNDMPELRGQINEVLRELYSPLSTDQKLKIAIPIIPSLVSYEMETNVPKLVADKIEELKNLLSRFKKKASE